MSNVNLPQEWDELHPRLPLRASKVVPLGRGERLTGDEQAELYHRAPVPVRDTLRVFLKLTAGRRHLSAGQERLERESGRDWRTIKRHRKALVDAGILQPRGGGYRGLRAEYWIRSPAEVDEWLREEAERRARGGGCGICGGDHRPMPRECPSFGRPVQERLDIEGGHP